MAKLILLVAVFAVVVLLLKNYQRSLARQRSESEEGAVQPNPGGEDMVRCAQCGVHLPKGESFLSQGSFFCSDEHRRLGVAPKRGKGEG